MTRSSGFTPYLIPLGAIALIAFFGAANLLSAEDSATSLAMLGLTGLAWLGGRPETAEAEVPTRRSGALASAAGAILLLVAPSQAGATSMMLSEVFASPSGPDDGLEWIELYNGTGAAVDLSTYSLGWGGADYAQNTLQLSGTVAAGDTFVVGGPISNASNFSPVFDQIANFAANLEGGAFWVADGIALFDVVETSVTASTVPIDTVVYGWTGAFNLNGLMDATGNVSAVDVTSFTAGVSFERTSTGWVAQAAPTPGSAVVTPEPGTATTVLCGLTVLAGLRRRSRAAR